MDQTRLEALLMNAPNLRIGVIGDFFLDEYWMLDPKKEEVSLETGLLANQVIKRCVSPGAAGTVVNNLCALNTGSVQAIGVLGDDGYGMELRRVLADQGVDTRGLVTSQQRITPVYIKPMRQEQDGLRELNRFDHKNWAALPPVLEKEMIRLLCEVSSELDILIAADQVEEFNHGVITAAVRSAISDLACRQGAPRVLVDSRRNSAAFAHCLIKPNQAEAFRAVGAAETDAWTALEHCASVLYSKTQKPLFITLGSAGILVFDGKQVQRVPAPRLTGPLDIVGAGDSAMAGLSVALGSGASLLEAAEIACLAAAVTVQQIGTTGTAAPEEVLKQYRRSPLG